MNGAPPAIVAHGLRKSYGTGPARFDALRGVSLEIEQGEYVAVMGPSGSGKSTLLQLLGALDQPSGGTVEIAGANVFDLSDAQQAKFRADEMGFIFQAFHLIPRTAAWKNVELVTRFRSKVPSATDRKKDAYAALAKVGLQGKETNKPNELSGGQRQRVAIARALVNHPHLIMADEPTGNLDTKSGHQILGLFDALHKQGKTIILVTHDPEVAKRAERIIVVQDGRIVSNRRQIPRRSPEPVDLDDNDEGWEEIEADPPQSKKPRRSRTPSFPRKKQVAPKRIPPQTPAQILTAKGEPDVFDAHGSEGIAAAYKRKHPAAIPYQDPDQPKSKRVFHEIPRVRSRDGRIDLKQTLDRLGRDKS